MTVTVYSTTNCGICHALMQWLDKNNISYGSKVVDQADDLMAEFLAVSDGIISTPFTVIDSGKSEPVKIVGFDQSRLKPALGIA